MEKPGPTPEAAVPPLQVRALAGLKEIGAAAWDACATSPETLAGTDETRPDFLSWRVDHLPCAATHLCRRLGHLPVLAWTVRDRDQRRAARGPDAVRGLRAVR